jgi:hypothetical protein
LSSIVENGAEWVKVLQKENTTLTERAKILPELKEAFIDLLNIEASTFDKLWG